MPSALSLDDPTVARDVARLGPYSRRALEAAADHAHRLHAEEVTVEHLLSSLFLDEQAGATRLVLHAFADPETLSIELLALSPGILVVGSGRSVPFSVRGVRALESARALAAAGAAASVGPAHVAAAAVAELEPEVLQLLESVGLKAGGAQQAAAAESAGDPPVPESGPLFQRFRQEARRALGAAARAATQWERAAISPAHLVLGALEADSDLGERLGTRASRVRMALGGRDEDATPLVPRRLAPDRDLAAVLSNQEDGAGTAALLGHVLSRGSEEVRLLLQRQRITWELFERAHAAFDDPDVEHQGA